MRFLRTMRKYLKIKKEKVHFIVTRCKTILHSITMVIKYEMRAERTEEITDRNGPDNKYFTISDIYESSTLS